MGNFRTRTDIYIIHIYIMVILFLCIICLFSGGLDLCLVFCPILPISSTAFGSIKVIWEKINVKLYRKTAHNFEMLLV
jgi:hypothetical protein